MKAKSNARGRVPARARFPQPRRSASKTRRTSSVRALSWGDCGAIGAKAAAYLVAAVAAVACVSLACLANMDWSANADPVKQGVQFASIIGGALFFSLSALIPPGAAGRIGFAVLAVVCISFNVWCAYENASHRNAQVRDNLRGEISAAQRYDSERVELVAKRDRAATVSGREPSDALEARIAAARNNLAWRRSRECTDVTLPDSKALCDGFRDLQARLAAARAYERLSFELRALDAERQGKAAPASASPEIDGLAVGLAFLGFELDEQGKTVAAVVLRDFWPAAMVEIFAAIGPFSAFRLASLLLLFPSAPQRRPTDGAPLKKAHTPTPDTVGASTSPVARFITEALEPAKGGRIEAGALYQHYRRWAAVHGVEPISQQAFGREAGALIKRASSKRRQYLGFALRPMVPVALHAVAA